ncbi:hypothetical protein ACP70R_002718 [Stipagrostis hirtigluma subsp. patula]
MLGQTTRCSRREKQGARLGWRADGCSAGLESGLIEPWFIA